MFFSLSSGQDIPLFVLNICFHTRLDNTSPSIQCIAKLKERPRTKFCEDIPLFARNIYFHTRLDNTSPGIQCITKLLSVTSLLSSLPVSHPYMPIRGSRYGRFHIFLNMHADGRRYGSGCILWWRILVCAAV